ncbi:MAG: hypothetical protein MRZ61_02695 [Oscillospiraceae bacterium]|nr:hypothetical protein [Oscillospiraceae bacterium]
MKLKRILAGICAAAMAVTQTAIVPLNVSAVQETPVAAASNAGFNLSVSSFSKDNTNWWADTWDNAGADAGAKTLTLSAGTLEEKDTPTPDDNTKLAFSYSAAIPNDGTEVGDVFDVSISNLKIVAAKNIPGTEDAATTLSETSQDMDENSVTINAIEDIAAGDKITVTYTVDADVAEDAYAAIKFVDASGIALNSFAAADADSEGVDIVNKTAEGDQTYEITIAEDDVSEIAANGFVISGKNITVTKVERTVPGTAATTVTDTLVLGNVNFTQVKQGNYYFDNEQTIKLTNVSFENFKDFKENGSVTATWDSLTCTGTKYTCEGNEIWAGKTTLNWNGITLPATSAEADGTLTVNFTPVQGDEAQLKFYYVDDSGNWVNMNVPGSTYVEEDSAYIVKGLESNSSFDFVLDEELAGYLTNGKFVVSGAGVTVTSVEYAEPAVYTLPYESETGVDLSKYSMKFEAASVEEGGTITIGFKEKVSSLTIKNSLGETIESFDSNTASDTLSIVLNQNQAEDISDSGFAIVGTKGVVVSVKYEAPQEPKPEVKYTVSDGEDGVNCKTWTEVLAAIKDKTKDYTITLLSDVTEGKITFPAATKAKSVTVDGGCHTFTIDNTALTLPTDVKFYNITLESSDKTKGLTITANKNFVDGCIISKTLKTVKGSSKSVLTFDFESKDITYSISGFGTVVGTLAVGFNLDGETATTLEAATLEFYGYDGEVIIVGNCNARFTNVKVIDSNKSCRIRYADAEDFTPVTITGTVTTEKPIIISASNNKFKNGDTVLISKTADLSKFVIDENSLPDDGIEYTLAKVGSEVKVMKTVFSVYFGDEPNVTFAQWSDVLNYIADNAKNGRKDLEYVVELLADVNIGGALTMPKAGTYDYLYIDGGGKTLTFTGTTVSITEGTTFGNIILKSVKKNSTETVDFSFNTGKNGLVLQGVTGKIKDIKSTGEVTLGGTTINGNVSANDLYIWGGTEPTRPGIKAAPNAFEPQAIDKTSVTVNGNLTVKNMLCLEGSLTVKGAFSAAGVASDAGEDEIALVLTQNTKKPASIGKLGFDSESDHIKFALVDPTTGKTVQIVEDTVIASISGPYADQLVPCDENLAEDESYYIVKENGKLVAKSTDTSFVEIKVNGNVARYASLDDAIKDINATGSKDDKVEFKITQAMFSEPIAKLPLPNAGKYDWLTYTADEPVTINVTSDLALTGNLTVDTGITINKVTVNKTTKETTVVPISVNVGKYAMLASSLSVKTVEESTVSQIANISGTDTFNTAGDVVVTGKVNVGAFAFFGNTVTLEGTKSSFTASVFVSPFGGTLVYDKANAKNVKFGDISGDEALTVKIDGVKAGDAIASITGDYTAEMIEIDGSDDDSDLVVARSDKNLVAVSESSVIKVDEYKNGEPYATRVYDTLENAMKDINRLNNKDAVYLVSVTNANGKTYSKLPLPSANKYNSIQFNGSGSVITINVTSDITLTGDCYIDGNVTINKVDKNGKVVEMSVNTGNYDLRCIGKFSYDKENSVNQLKNVSGKGYVWFNGNVKISGKVNVGTIGWDGTMTLDAKAGFAAKVHTLFNKTILKYPVAVGKNVKLGTIIDGYVGGPGTLYVQIDGVKAGDQIAALTGDYFSGTVVINGGSEFTAVRSGTKLLAVANGTEVTVSDGTKTRAYDTYENAIADITRLANADGVYTICLPAGKYEWAKLALPAKGKYKSVTLVSSDEGDAEISVKSDVTLSGNLVIGFGVTLQKVKTFGGDPVSPFKFTSAKNKDGSPVYTVTVYADGKIVNGTLNGKEIVNPSDIVYTVGHNFGDGIDLKAYNYLLFNRTNVAEGGKIVVTFKEPVSGRFTLFVYDENVEVEPIGHITFNGEYKVEFTLSGSDANSITNNIFGFFSNDTDCIVTSVTYEAPEVDDGDNGFDQESGEE